MILCKILPGTTQGGGKSRVRQHPPNPHEVSRSPAPGIPPSPPDNHLNNCLLQHDNNFATFYHFIIFTWISKFANMRDAQPKPFPPFDKWFPGKLPQCQHWEKHLVALDFHDLPYHLPPHQDHLVLVVDLNNDQRWICLDIFPARMCSDWYLSK